MTDDSIFTLKKQSLELVSKYLSGEDFEAAVHIINNDFLPLGVGKHLLYLLTTKRCCEMTDIDKSKLKEVAHLLGM